MQKMQSAATEVEKATQSAGGAPLPRQPATHVVIDQPTFKLGDFLWTGSKGALNAMGQAITVIVIAGVAALIGNIFRSGIAGGIMALIMSLIGYAVWSILVVLIGTKIMPEPTTKADFNEAFRVIGFTASPGVFNVLAIVPFLGPLISFVIGIWMLVIGVIAVREVLDYSNIGRAIIVCLIAFCDVCGLIKAPSVPPHHGGEGRWCLVAGGVEPTTRTWDG